MASKEQAKAASAGARTRATGSGSGAGGRPGSATTTGRAKGAAAARSAAKGSAAKGSGSRATAAGSGSRATAGGTSGKAAPKRTAVGRAAPESQRAHRSAVEALLAPHPGDTAGPDARPRAVGPDPEAAAQAAAELAEATRSLLASALLVPTEHTTADAAAHLARHAASGGPSGDVVRLDPRTGLPSAQDVALGVASIVVERLWRAGASAIAWGNGVAARSVSVARAVSPQVASAQADARLQRLAARGQRVRQERAEALAASFTAAITSAATSDAVRGMAVAAIEEATDEVLEVVLPAMLEAITERETQDKLDELMAGLLLRQLPAALEKTIPQVMLRTATRPAAGLMPFLGGVLPR
jgi:trimeric autotransporter adhesin